MLAFHEKNHWVTYTELVIQYGKHSRKYFSIFLILVTNRNRIQLTSLLNSRAAQERKKMLSVFLSMPQFLRHSDSSNLIRRANQCTRHYCTMK